MFRHRRFGGFLEFDHNGPPFEGTPEQQLAIRTAIQQHMTYGSPLHQTMQAIDRAVNRTGRRYIPVGFWPLHESGRLGFCFPSYIQLGEQLHPDYVVGIFLHELGHLVGWQLKAWSGGGTEYWPEAFKNWILAGQPEDDEVWARIQAVL